MTRPPMRVLATLLLIAAVASSCSRTPATDQGVVPPAQTAARSGEPSPAEPSPEPLGGQSPGQSKPAPDGQSPAGPDPCRGPVTAGPPSVMITADGVSLPLPMSDCAISLPAGQIRLALLINNLQQQATITVTGASEGRWEGDRYLVDFDLAEGEELRLSLDVSAYSQSSPLTYTFTGAPAIDAVLASGPSREGPWTAIRGEVVPPEAAWLRIMYPRPLKPASPSIITDDQYAMPGEGLPGEWEGDRVQYVAIGDRKPVLSVTWTADENGLQLYFPVSRLYRGNPPELQRINPSSGAVQPVYRWEMAPWQLQYLDGQVRWPSQDGKVTALNPLTGEPVPAAPDSMTSDEKGYPSPDGSWVAELIYPDGEPQPFTTEQHWPVSVTIREGRSGKALVQVDRELTTWGVDGCIRNSPGLGWRTDSQALAVLDAPAPDRLVVKEINLSGTVRTLAEWTGLGASFQQMAGEVKWSPSGELLVVGNHLVEVATGLVLTDSLPKHTFWSPDSRYLLLHEPDHIFTPWGAVSLLDLETGKELNLGQGLGLGWTPQGEALLVRWDVSKEISPPGKDC